MTMKPLSASAQRVQDALSAAGIETTIVEYDVPARTSAEAAAVLGCSVAQIAKSLVFKTASGLPVLVIASGANRVDEAKVSALVGYAIGGIPPLGHARTLPALIDRELLRFDAVYAAGGTPHAMFPLSPTDLVRVANGTVADVALLAN
jgi:prolyl-tRNA editing enzyme YbaK/EbsC (Cys-tRNA(Pro) deacylase)